ncbi:uncharacterized protein OCT59_008296 [Rhizophagus irregularis]|uniref:F-box domain-containing protein n=1 Tax=Rhizophagus irregularis (strain DAOM 181602 / DAOM 197198 / MUCL 43194) TaxID=747089 RepID=A0A2P4PHL7_RHIID|nr:hypothetical protein GLOIN_2v1880972 [Rhizophagus irregularis DAOM 181602=DAOM 197198]POG64885.1 hypothetical protein GLOIN_2v1880972 [Rhizophagus irregularis DAOM 181602=DAOM 197198]UZO16930.1 hypothetical protein OCT59_008296 [Rhizophagus irregularis]|eukprot:XP_025171751.1 hypothetical protein GLOIN_2v1880972 [Rhizophagus irregularis DAOM 181602=DAOM 197198]
MSCSKIFSGDLPELTYDVIKYFQKDFSTLYSCILVNRLWCRLAIPLLWEEPFTIHSNNHKIIEIYLNNFNDDFKMKLYEYKIINNSLPSKNMLLFDYLKFLKYLNTLNFFLFVEIWLSIAIDNLKPENILYDSEKNFKRLFHMSLFKIFIENEVNLNTLEIEASGSYCDTYLENNLELILQNQNFIQNIRNLKLHIYKYEKNTVIYNQLLQIIHSHQNLKKIFLFDLSINYLSFYQSLLLSKDYNCSNTLNTIVLYQIELNLMNNLDKIFEQLNVLESVHIIYCSFLNSNFIQQIINLTKPFKLKSLILNDVPQFESLQQLLLKSGDYLENFGGEFYYNHDISQLLNYCNNINFLYFTEYENKNSTYQKINLIENIKKSLNYLSIKTYSPITSSIILKNLGQILPSKLDYISLNLNIEKRDFRLFLENSQYSFINKLLILQCGDDDILHCIKDYCIMRVKYLAIKDHKKELFDLKDKVRELELRNIKVQRHIDLDINICNFMKEY